MCFAVSDEFSEALSLKQRENFVQTLPPGELHMRLQSGFRNKMHDQETSHRRNIS